MIKKTLILIGKSLLTLFIVIFVTILIVLLVSIGNYGKNQIASISKNNLILPDADFVFQTFIRDPASDGDKYEALGFYSFTDNKVTLVTDNEINNGYFAIQAPHYLDSDTVITLNKRGNRGSIQENYFGDTLIISDYQYIKCRSALATGFYIEPHNGNLLLMSQEWLNLIDSNNCSKIKLVLDHIELQKFGSYEDVRSIGTYAMSNDDKYLIFSPDENLVRLDLINKKSYDYQRIGTNPAFSPDQQKIAYVGMGGIHVMDISGDNDQLIVKTKTGQNFDLQSLPKPDWSNDGNKLLYHKCSDNYGRYMTSYAIYVYDFDTQTETKLIDNAINPSWRKVGIYYQR